jgi:alpha-beta hydrolase superfamily lysophospholipase
MPSPDILFAFLVTTAVFAYIPGPAMLYAAAQTVARGRTAGLMATLGIHLGCYVHVFAAAAGLSILFHAVPTLYLAAEQDQNAPYDFAADAQRLYDATGTAEKKVEVVPGSLHGVALIAGSARVRALLEAFVRDPAGTVP